MMTFNVDMLSLTGDILMLMLSRSKFSTLFVFSCAEMYICIVLEKIQNSACKFLSSVISGKKDG